MSWLLFLDESGQDHKNCPYEVRGGIAVHASKLWPLVQRLQAAELAAFGDYLREYAKEYKGSKLLDKDRFKWAKQAGWMEDAARRKHARGFLTKGLEKKVPTRDEFTGYGQANIEMARSVFESLRLVMRAYSRRSFLVPLRSRRRLRQRNTCARTMCSSCSDTHTS
jgi:hypothetical protein